MINREVGSLYCVEIRATGNCLMLRLGIRPGRSEDDLKLRHSMAYHWETYTLFRRESLRSDL